MAKQLLYTDDARKKLLAGAEKLAKAVGITIIWSGVVAYVSYKIVDMTVGLRVPEDEEREGLDISSHGESAYRM